ncbi:MAG: zinc-dependent metalloprotease, partial [Actinomycetota bacterium]
GFTALQPDRPAGAPVVVDRAGWIAANVESFRGLLHPLAERFGNARAGGRIGRSAIGFQVGLLLGYLSQKVLGQYDLLLATGGAGKVYFVGPNIVAAERRWKLRPEDFRLWIALHEVTHRTQFVAVPWLRDHVAGLIERYLSTAEIDAKRIREAIDSIRSLIAQGPQAWKRANVLTLFLTPAQREVVASMQSLMTVVEGHGNFVMDRVGAEHIETFADMKEALTAQRQHTSIAERTLQKAMGLDMKYAQYTQGESFVAAVEASSGMSGVNLVWERAENLPTTDELNDPQAWLTRVLREQPPAGG